MEYILYKKNIRILKYKEINGNITVLQVYNKEHLPVHLFVNGIPSSENLYALNEKMEQFLDNRLIPSTRKNLKDTLKEMEIDSNYKLAEKSWFLSLSDQYWICPFDQENKLFWEDINFFTNDYDPSIGLRLLNNSVNLNKNSSSYSPDNTTNGELPKRWFKQDGINYLEKAGSGTEQQEPINELLASEICRRLNISYVPYYLSIRNGNYYCYCPDIVDDTKELVPMDSIYQDLHLIDGRFYDYSQLINRCNEMNIPDAEIDILKILLLDFIIANTDRHSYNISFIRNSVTLQWIGVSPVYDSGKSMFLNLLDFEMEMMGSGQIEAKPFFGTQSKQIQNIPINKLSTIINLDTLNDIGNWYSNLLKPLKRFTEEKKRALVKKLNERIAEAKKILLSSQPLTAVTNGKHKKIDLVYAALKENPNQTKEELSKITGISRSTITRIFKELKKMGKIQRIASNKTGYWKVF